MAKSTKNFKSSDNFELDGRMNSLHWFVLALSAGLTILAWQISDSQVEEKKLLEFNRQTDQVLNMVIERMAKYEDALWAGSAMLYSRGFDINLKEWRTFSENLHLTEKYPGINGIGIIEYVKPENLTQFERTEQIERPYFRVHPPHFEKEYWPIRFIEPENTNRTAVGLDMAHEENRLNASRIARDTGTSIITGPIKLVQDTEKTPGFLFFVPHYSRTNPSSETLRRKFFKGLVYAPFVVKKLMLGTLAKENRQVDIKIVDNNTVIYDESDPQENSSKITKFSKSVPVNFYGRTWNFEIWANYKFIKSTSNSQPILILVAGIIIDLLLFLVFTVLSRSKTRAVRYANQANSELIQQTKDLEALNKNLNREVKNRRLAEKKADEANKTKSDFLENMSHELRTPLHGIIGFAEMLGEKEESPESKEYAEMIKNCGETMLKAVNDLLDISRMETDDFKLQNEVIYFKEFIDLVKSVAKTTLANSGIEFQVLISDNLPHTIEGDKFRIKQIVLNLLNNAIKFTKEGKISVAFNVSMHTEENCRIQIEVSDTGIGIPKEKLNEVLEPFNQVEKALNRFHDGIGLGLSIVNKVIQKMSGSISIDSDLGKGTRVSVEFETSVLEWEERDRSKQDIFDKTPKQSDSEFDILVVEDNRTNQKLILGLLEKVGFSPDLAENGLEAVSMCKKKNFHLIIMDIRMPIMDGITATKEIRSLNKNFKPYILALTANAHPQTKLECMEAGMDNFLTKPLRKSDLMGLLDELKEKFLGKKCA